MQDLEKQLREAAAAMGRGGSIPQEQLVQLLSAAQQHCRGSVGLSASLEEALESLLSHVKQLVGGCSGLKDRVQALEQTVESQQGAMERQRSDAQLLRQQVLLGQLAYLVDDAAMQYVMADERGRRMRKSLSVLLAQSKTGKLNQQQQQRLQDLSNLVSAKQPGLTLEDVDYLCQPLETARLPIAHGTPQEQQQVSSEQLLRWALAEGHGEEEVQQLLSVAQLFSQPGKPLVLDPSWPAIHLSS